MNGKILIIPDVHGRSFWKEALNSGCYDKVIFLGDYVDPYEIEGIDPFEALSNFKDILSLKNVNQDRVVLLLGNHDLCYFSDHYRELAESDRYDYEYAEELKRLFCSWRHCFSLAHEELIGNTHYLFSHAGVTWPWLKQNVNIICNTDVHHLNQLIETHEGIETLAQVGSARGGDYLSGSIVWADIAELAISDPLPNTYQIVGHSMQSDGPVITDKFACLDCRAAFSLDEDGHIDLVTELTSYEDIISSFFIESLDM